MSWEPQKSHNYKWHCTIIKICVNQATHTKYLPSILYLLSLKQMPINTQTECLFKLFFRHQLL